MAEKLIRFRVRSPFQAGILFEGKPVEFSAKQIAELPRSVLVRCMKSGLDCYVAGLELPSPEESHLHVNKPLVDFL